MSADVFISYAAKDRERVAKLVEGLQQAGVSVWIDMDGIEVAAMWSREIVSAIRECKVLLLSISTHSTESENVVKELALASERKKPIIPIYLEPAEIPETMEYQLAGIQRVEFFEGREDLALQAVIRALSKLGVTVADEASAAAAGASNIAAHGAGHSSGKTETKGESAVWLKVAAAVVGLAVLGMAGTFFFGSSTTTAPLPIALGPTQTNTTTQATLDTNRIVVLPFKVIGGAKDSEDLGYGLVSTLTSKLQPLQNLVVIAKESARKFEDSKQSPNEIGQALGAGTLVTGEIQTSNDKIQVNIQLINANTEALGWGNTFTKTKNEFLDLQNEIATKLASELKGGLDAAETRQLAQKATENPEAQAEYQAGRREWNKRNKEGFDKAIKHFEKAIELDPDYADPYSGLADTHLLMVNYRHIARDKAIPKAKIYAEKAIEKNPNLASAYTSIAWLQHVFEYDWAKADANYKKAIQLNSNYATGSHWYGMLLNGIGKTEEAVLAMERAAQLDPTSMIIKATLASIYKNLGKEDLALKYADEALAISPYFQTALSVKYIALQAAGIEGGIDKYKELLKTENNENWVKSGLFKLYMMKGDKEAALDQFSEIVADPRTTQQNCFTMVSMYTRLGKFNHAIVWLEKAIKNKEPIMNRFASKDYNSLKTNPRFIELMKSINHPLYVD
jgi:TolB-like protein/lipopolysaccharide biosynthesis regulator YciM